MLCASDDTPAVVLAYVPESGSVLGPVCRPVCRISPPWTLVQSLWEGGFRSRYSQKPLGHTVPQTYPLVPTILL